MHKLGDIVVPGAGTPDANNRNTAAPFVILPTTQYLEIMTTGTDVYFEVTADPTDISTFATDTTKGFPLLNGISKTIKTGPWGANTVIACHSALGATVEVWASRT